MAPPYLFAIVAVLCGATAQSVTGLGFSLIAAPLLTLVFAGGDGVRLGNALSVLVNLLLLRREWRNTDWRLSLVLFAPAAAIAPFVGIGLTAVNPILLQRTVGLIVLAVVAMLAVGFRAKVFTGIVGGILAGALSGAMNVIGGVSGPIAASYAANADWPPEKLRPTLNTYFLGINIVSVLVRGVPSVPLTVTIALLVTIFGGFAIGAVLSRYLNKAVVQRLILSLAALGAVCIMLRTE